MSSTIAIQRETGTFPRGVHPSENKHLGEHVPIEVLPTPEEVLIPLLQHLGAPCEPTVKSKVEVKMGDVIGNSNGFISAPVHTSVSGTVGRPSVTTLPNGRHVSIVPVKSASEQPFSGETLLNNLFGGEWQIDGWEQFEPQQIADAARQAGIVGMGGAAFPLHVKLTRNEKKPIKTVLVNGCECEPYLTSDHRLMLEAPQPIITGALLAKRAAGADEVIICIEDNKPDAAESIRKAAEGKDIQIRLLKTKYPQGGEKQLVYAVLKKEVPLGGLPLDIGAVVINVGTASALARAVLRGKPLTHRIVSVTGSGIAQPRNLLVPIGATYKNLIDYCGGLKPDAIRVVSGGPMMGFAITNLDTPVTKGTSGITVLTIEEIKKSLETTCVRCGRCVDVCPMNLVPTKIAMASRADRPDIMEKYYIAACMECGCCAYACPAGIPLVQLIRVGKIKVKNTVAAKTN